MPADGAQITTAENDTLEERAATVPGKTVSGVQKKLLAYRDGAVYRPRINRGDPATHIAKFNAPERATLVQNENLTLTLAREVLGEKEVTAAHIAKLEGVDEIALVVERFDRADGRRLRLEDFAQILEVPSGRDFGGKYQSSYEEAASVIVKWSSRSAIDLLRFFRLIVFNCVVGNADAHLKNFSLLERPEGQRLSPAYDLMNTVAYGEYDADTGLSIGGKKRPLEAIERSLLRGFGREIGLEEAAVERAFSDLARKFADPGTLKFGSNVSFDDFRARYAEVVQANAQRIFT
ncbi:HipA domain-containing protein [Parasphingopyxis algicola]|uniref:HipA domain-containing protein n=1 Tax=Parasphingopyxis algicola TaxID=2026624 RepID=UPI001FE6F3F6|nr:HipA domain-containing protein [Parasphingopyxis algicola]